MSANTLALIALASSVGCLDSSSARPATEARDPVLTSRPGTPSLTSAKGKTVFAVEGSNAVVYVPASVDAAKPVGLVLFLHGANRTVDFFVDGHKPVADTTNVIVLAPYATIGTWDAINGPFSNDITIIDSALAWVFQRWSIDPAKIVISGFSDGATYSLAVGRANGDFFTRVVAYSPGFLIEVAAKGKPPILVSHGTEDVILSFQYTKNVIVPTLRDLGHTVDFREFTGPHAVQLAAMRDVLNAIRSDP